MRCTDLLTDTAGGAGNLKANADDCSNALLDLGLTAQPVANVITGTDVSPVKAMYWVSHSASAIERSSCTRLQG